VSLSDLETAMDSTISGASITATKLIVREGSRGDDTTLGTDDDIIDAEGEINYANVSDEGLPEGPIAVDGWFPLFADEQEAIDFLEGATAAHTHEVTDDLGGNHTMYMPTGGVLDTDYFHGNYPTDTEYEDEMLDIA
jgi:hypothetical protein